MTFKVSPGTKVEIVGHYSKTVFKTFKGRSASGKVTLHYTFDDSGTYDIVATKGDKSVTKKLVVKDYEGSSSSENSSSEKSNSSASSNSTSSSSKSNDSQSNHGSSTGASQSGGSSYSGGGSSSGGGGSSYVPRRPSAPSRPAPAPSAPSNGTGAMTGGGY